MALLSFSALSSLRSIFSVMFVYRLPLARLFDAKFLAKAWACLVRQCAQDQ